MKKLIIFDCDGTLVDSEELNNRATVELFQELGFDVVTREYAMTHFIGRTLSDNMLQVQMETGCMPPENFRQRYVDKVAELQQTGLRPVAGAPETVRAAVAAGYKVCVASNGERANVLSSLELAGLDSFFGEDKTFTKIQVKHPKPAPDLFLFAAAQMGAVAEDCLVIEDSLPGLQAARAAGMTAWGLTQAAHDPDILARDMAALPADRVFADYGELAAALGVNGIK